MKKNSENGCLLLALPWVVIRRKNELCLRLRVSTEWRQGDVGLHGN